MRFLSKFAKFSVKLIDPDERPLPNGKLHIVVPGVNAQFRPTNISDYEYKVALDTFQWNGRVVEEDGMTPVGVRFRVGVYDTDEEARNNRWTEERRVEIEGLMKTAIGYGVDFVAVEAPKLAAPWPSYDEIKGPGAINKIKMLVTDGGYDAAYVVEYEKQNRNREPLIAELEALIPEPEVKVEEPDEVLLGA